MRLGLITRIALALASVGLIPLLVGVLPLIGLQRTALQDQVLQNHITAARAVAGRIDAQLTALRSLATSLAENRVLASDPRSREAQELLASLLQARPDLGALAITDPEGISVVRLQRREHSAAMDSVLASLPGEEPQRILSGSTAWLVFDQPIADGAGYVRVVADMAPLAAAVESIELGRGEADLVLADGSGEVLAGNLASLRTFPPDLITAGRSGQLAGARVYTMPQGGRVLGAIAPVPASTWFVASRQPAAIAERVAVALRRRTGIALSMALVLVGLLSISAHRRLVRPIQQLIDAQRRLAGLQPLRDSGNEITQLRSSFAVLEEQLHTREEIDRVFLGRYQVVSLLNEGAMGTIFRGWDPRLQRPVALKTVRLRESTFHHRGKLATQLVREATTAAGLMHPNIVAIFDVEDTPEVAFFAMELVEGIGLDHLLDQYGPLPEPAILHIALAIAEALGHSHRSGVIHRDIKPANVLLGYDDGIKVTDFGVAELMRPISEDAETVFGTPGYIPPETLLGGGFSAKGDLFALGVVLYECLTGEQPFLRRTLKETVLCTVKEAVAAPRLKQQRTSPALDELVTSLLAKEPADRPASAEAVVRCLNTILDSLPAELAKEWRPETFFTRDGLISVPGTGMRSRAKQESSSRMLTAVRTQDISGEL